MPIYLGSSGVTITKVFKEKNRTEEIIQRTISGSYKNDQIIDMKDYAFARCYSLTEVNFPNCTTVGSDAFYNCTSLASVSLPQATTIGNNAFMSCFRLISLYLIEVSSVPALGTNVFDSTPIGGYSGRAGQYGSVYVPASLYNSFLTATNWSDIASRIISI